MVAGNSMDILKMFKDEIDRLKAQIERLREFAIDVRDEFPCDSDTVNALIEETPAQSLLLHNADLLESEVKRIGFYTTGGQYESGCNHVLEDIQDQSDALRQQALENKS